MPKPIGAGNGGGGNGGADSGDTTVFAVVGVTADGSALYGTGDPVLDGSDEPTRSLIVSVTDPAAGETWSGTTATWYLDNGTWYWTIEKTALTNEADLEDSFDDEIGDFNVVASYTDVHPKNGRTKLIETDPFQLTVEGEVIDTVAPTASTPVLLASSDSGTVGDGITSETLATFRIELDPTVEAGDTIALRVNELVDVTRVLTQADIDQAYVDLTTSGTTLAEGDNIIVARLSDAAGNSSDTSASTVTLDTSPPPASIDHVEAADGVPDADALVSDATPVFSGQTEAGATVDLYKADGTFLGQTTSSDGTWTITSATLPDGDHDVYVVVTDAAGNTATSANFALTVDTAVDTAEVHGITEDTGVAGDNITSDTAPVIEGKAEVGATVMVYAIIDGAVDLSLGFAANVSADGRWTASPGTLGDGTHVFRAEVTDAAGNTAWTSDIAVTVDTEATEAALSAVLVDDGGTPDSLALADGGTTTDSSPLLSGSAERFARVEIFLDGLFVGETTADDSGAWSFALSSLAEGTHQITLTTTDLAGNVAGDARGASVHTFTVAPAPEPEIDPLYAEQWNLQALGDLEAVWQDYTGAGVTVAVYDDGVAYDHVDLDDNYDTSLQLNWNSTILDPYPTTENEGRHGTAVAGVIASEKNGEGTIGIAYDATLVGVNIFSGPANINDTNDVSGFEFAIAEMDNFDVVNHSWGAAPMYLNDTSASSIAYLSAVEEAATLGRLGLGTIVLKAAGNWADSAQGDANDATRYSITVGAYDSDGDASWYSNRGANILISAPSSGLTIADGEGNLLPESDLRIPTTDRDGAFGYADGSWSSAYETSGFGGTSAATPTAAGVVALMLESNPELGWRDVQNILAQSATWTGGEIGVQSTQTEIVPVDLDSDLVFEATAERQVEYFAGTWNGSDAWNGGGMHFSEDYGFGAVNALAAVRMAEVWGLFGDALTSANEAQFSTGTMTPDGLSVSGAGDITTWSFDYSGPAMDLEYVDISIVLNTTLMQEVALSITSPDGTTVSLLDVPINDYTPAFEFSIFGLLAVDVSWTFGANSFRGEDPNGTWTVTLEEKDVTYDVDYYGTEYDGNIISNIAFDFYGSSGAVVEDDVYTYTDEMLALDLASDTARLEIDDAGGTDWLNLAAMTSDISLNLSSGISANDGTGAAQIAVFTADTVIENAVTGDGDDTLIGDGGNNILAGMRGIDTIDGGAGNDEIFGHFGDDILTGGTGADVFYFEFGHGNDTITDFDQSAFEYVSLFGFVESNFELLTFDVAGTDQVLSFSSGDSLTFANAADLTFNADDFLFDQEFIA